MAAMLSNFINNALTVVEEFETNIDNCKNKDVVYKIKQKVELPFVLRDPITKGYLFVANNDEPGGIAPYNYTQIFITYGGIKKRNGTQADMISPFVWEEWEDYSSNDGSVEIMSQEEFNDLLNSGANWEAFEGKATEALTMAVYDGAIKANANHILTLRDEKANKATISTSSDTEFVFDLADNHNKEIRLTAVLSSISFNIPAELNDNYISSLSFSTGDTELPINYPSGGVINWVGTDCSISDGISNFIPSPNMHYDIVFYYNGSSVVGMVNGFVPAEVTA